MKSDLIRLKMDNDFIEVRVDVAEDGSTSGAITSNLHVEETPMDTNERYNSMIDALESLILAHACEGVDIRDSKYIAGVRTTIDAIGNNA